MANVSKIKLPNNSSLDVKALAIPIGTVDSTSTSTVFTFTVPGITSLYNGVIFAIRNTVVASASGWTANVNGLGAKQVYGSNNTRVTTGFAKNYWYIFVYDEANDRWTQAMLTDANSTYTNVALGQGYGTCTTAAATAAKVVTLASYALTTGGIVAVKFDNDVPANATMNINSKGAKAIYHRGAAITAGVIKGGDTAYFIYSTYYHLLGVDRIISKVSDLTNDAGYTTNIGTITKVGNTTSGEVAVTSSNNTASYGSAVTVGTVGGVDLKFTMPASTDDVVETTYSNLKSLRDNNQLRPGCKYRITDYVATVETETSGSLNSARSANHPFDIIVTAIDESNLSEEASAALHSGDTYFANSDLNAWKVWYTIDNDLMYDDTKPLYTWADTTNGKGVIFRLIDEFGNDLGYDFKGIQFKRYKISPATGNETILAAIDGMYLGIDYTDPYGTASHVPYTGTTVDTSDYKWFYTFNRLSTGWDDPIDASLCSAGQCYNNIIPTSVKRHYVRFLNNNVFFAGPFIGSTLNSSVSDAARTEGFIVNFIANADCSRNTFFGGVSATFVESQCRDNLIFGSCRHNSFHSDTEENTIVGPEDISFNITDGYFHGNIISTSTYITRNNISQANDIVLYSSTDEIRNNEIFYSYQSNCKCTKFSQNRIYLSNNNSIVCANYNNNDITFSSNNTINASTSNFEYNSLQNFSSNTITATFAKNRIPTQFMNNTISNTFENNHIKYYFQNNTNTGTFRNNEMIGGQITYCTFAADIFACNLHAVLQYIRIPAVASKRFAYNTIYGGIRGTSSDIIVLDYSQFYLSSVSGINRWVNIEASVDGKIVATWKDNNGQIVGVYKLPTDTTWTPIESLYLTVSDYEQDEEVIAAAFNDINDRLRTKQDVLTIANTISSASTNDQVPSAKAVYDNVSIKIQSSQPAGGFLPNVFYSLGELSGDTTFYMDAASDNAILNHWYWTFDTPSTVPTITWPAAITKWVGGSAPTLTASTHYEISVINGIAAYLEV